MRAALAQIAPVLLDRARTLQKVEKAIREASSNGAELVCFGETLVPGYPIWVENLEGARFESAVQKDLYGRYVAEAVDLEAGDLRRIFALAEELKTYVILGVAEKDRRRGRSVFASVLSIGADGQLLSCHRKLMPTYEERLTWSPGDAHGLVTHPYRGFRVGALNCWENWMPLARAALHADGETLHVGIWPGSRRTTEPVTRFIAREGRSYVLSVSSVLRTQDIPEDFPYRAELVYRTPRPEGLEDERVFQDGGSCVAGPDGEWMVAPEGDGRERIIYVELDPARVDEERQSFDPAGHYARPELLELRVRTARIHARTDLEEA